MEPFSITVGCISLIGTITHVSKHIGLFVSEVRSARKDMDTVHRDLASLSLCLEALQADCTTRRVNYPESMRAHLGQCLNNCEIITQQMKDLLQKLQSGRLGRRVQWSLSSRDDMNKLQAGLEAQKSCIEIALSVGSIQILSAIEHNLASHGEGTAAMRESIAALGHESSHIRDRLDILPQLAVEMTNLREELSRLGQAHGRLNLQLNEFIKQSTKYASELTNPFAEELAAVEYNQAQARSKAVRHEPVPSATTSPDGDLRPPSPNSTSLNQTRTPPSTNYKTRATATFGSILSRHVRTASPPDIQSNTSRTKVHFAIPDRDGCRRDTASVGPSPISRQQLCINNRFLRLFTRKSNRDGCAHSEPACLHIREMKRLLDEGADVNFASDFTGVSPLQAELSHKLPRAPVVSFLVARGASVQNPKFLNLAVQAGDTESFRIVAAAAEAAGENVDYAALLRSAIAVPSLEVTQLLLEEGADVNDPELLHSAVLGLHVEVVRALLDAGADPNAVPKGQDAALISATKSIETESKFFPGPSISQWRVSTQESLDIIRLLLEGGADANAQDIKDWTALSHAVGKHCAQAVGMLLKYGATVDEQVLRTFRRISYVAEQISMQTGKTLRFTEARRKIEHLLLDHKSGPVVVKK